MPSGNISQYHSPPDVTNMSSWTSTLPTTVVRLSHQQCPSPLRRYERCALLSSNVASPKYYSYTTTVTLSPMVLRPVLCTSSNANPCSFTLPYSERFQ